ncbi:glycosyltransferase family 39 protein, partial [Planctomycetota bacterium]
MVSIGDKPAAGSDEAESGAPRRIVVFLILAVVFAGAGALRCYNINTPKFSFHPMRQHRSYAIARAFYFEQVDGLPEWRKEAALSNKENLETKEPAIMEVLVSLAYRAAGGERAWIAPVFTIFFWLVGGVFVYLITIRYASPYGAAAATGFYLFLPFGFFVSRSFQPESFMIMLFLMSLYAIFRYGQKPSGVGLLILAVISGFAILVKFIIIFP